MKFGLVVYVKTENIGDDIQSYAAKCFLPTIDYVIDREQLDTFETAGESVKAIMNGWYMYSKFNWPPSAQIDPLWVSIHITEQDYFGIGERFLDGCGGDYLRHYAPIGARDESTLQILARNHIPAFLSGCLTLTIPQFSNVEKTDEVLLVDLDEKSEAIVRKMYPAENFQSVTHNVNAEEYSALSVEDRLRRVEKLLRRYQGAKAQKTIWWDGMTFVPILIGAALLVLLTVLVIELKRAKPIRDMLLILLLLLIAYASVFSPHFLTHTFWMAPRTIYSFFSFITLLSVLILYSTNDFSRISAVLNSTLIILLVANVMVIQQVTSDQVATNRLDQEQAQ